MLQNPETYKEGDKVITSGLFGAYLEQLAIQTQIIRIMVCYNHNLNH